MYIALQKIYSLIYTSLKTTTTATANKQKKKQLQQQKQKKKYINNK